VFLTEPGALWPVSLLHWYHGSAAGRPGPAHPARLPQAAANRGVWDRTARSIAGLALVAGLTSDADTALAEPRLRPSVSVSQEFSDNVDLDPDHEQSAFITEVTPGVSFRGDTSRFRGGFDGSVTTRYTTEGDDQGFELDGDLTADADLRLVDDYLFLEGDASVSQQVLNNEEAQSEANQDTVQVYQVSPVLRNGWGGFAESELRYVLGQLLVNSDDVADTTVQIGQVSLASAHDFDRLRWLLDGRISEAVRSGDSNVSRADVDLETEYGITRWLSAILAGGYQSFDEGDSDADFDSPAYWGGFRWRPGRKTEVTFTYGKRDDRFSPAASLRYQFSKNSQFLARYSESLSTSQERLFENVSTIGINPESGVFIDERSDTPFDPRPDPFDIDDETDYIKALRTDLMLQRGPYTVTLRGYFGHEEQVSDGGAQDDFEAGTRDVYSIDAVWSRQFGRRLNFDLSGGFERTEFESGRKDDEYRIQPGLRYLLNPRATLFVDYRYRWKNSNDEAAEYTENRVGGGLRLAW
jgi:Putative beta-barrel porin 2